MHASLEFVCFRVMYYHHHACIRDITIEHSYYYLRIRAIGFLSIRKFDACDHGSMCTSPSFVHQPVGFAGLGTFMYSLFLACGMRISVACILQEISFHKT
jgi:hypothetical protein